MSKNDLLKRDDFIKLKIITEKVYIEELDKDILIKVMNGEERRRFQQKMASDIKDETETPVSMIPVLIAFCAVNEDYSPVFDIANDIEFINLLPCTVTSKIFNAAAKLNGMTENALEIAAKNSEKIPKNIS